MREFGPVQVFPPGLLGFLQLKNSGKNPEFLSDIISPSLEYRDWLFTARQLTVDPNSFIRGFLTANRGFFSWTSPLGVPQDEAWWVRSYMIRTQVVPAAESITYRPCWKAAFIGSNYGVGDVVGTANAGEVECLGGENFFLPPGAELGVWIKSCTSAAGIQLSVALEYVPLPI